MAIRFIFRSVVVDSDVEEASLGELLQNPSVGREISRLV